VIRPISKFGCHLPTICPSKNFGKDKGVLEEKKAQLSFEYEHSSKNQSSPAPSAASFSPTKANGRHPAPCYFQDGMTSTTGGSTACRQTL